MLGIDNSLSMQEQNVGKLALQSLTTLSLAMTKMEVGKISIASIDKGFGLLHHFETPLVPADIPFILSQFNFDYSDTNSCDIVTKPYFVSGNFIIGFSTTLCVTNHCVINFFFRAWPVL